MSVTGLDAAPGRGWRADLELNLRAMVARMYVRIVGSVREPAWIIGDAVLPALGMCAFVLLYRGLGAPRSFETVAVLGGIMSTYWNGGYALWSGTSMSVPFVVGAAALRIQMDPGTPDEIRQVIEDTSARFPGDDSYPDTFAGLIGEGRVDLYSLVIAKRTMAFGTTLVR